MSKPGQGPLSLAPDSKVKLFLAGEAIAKGQCVQIKVDEGAASYKVVLADSDTGTLKYVVGVAKGAVASGSWGEFYVAGYCPAVLSGGSVGKGDPLIPSTTAGTAVSGTVGTNDGYFFGFALSDDTGSPVYCDAYLNCYGSAS